MKNPRTLTAALLAVSASALFFSCAKDETKTQPATSPYTGNTVTPYPGSSSIAGAVQGTGNCATGTASIALMSMSYGYGGQGSTVYPQTQAPIGGNFQLNVQPGSYVLYAQSTSGCFAQQQVNATANQVSSVTVVLSATGTGANTGGGYGWGYNPCPWGYYGCYGGYYPGGGGGMVGKPNVYLNGHEGLKFKARLKIEDGNHLLAAVPIHGVEGWSGEIKGGKLVVEKAAYDYLFYDVRIDTEKLSERGSCMETARVVPTMTGYLKNAGFVANEVKDFEDYWSKRIPPAGRYCIYVQDETDIKALMSIEIEPKPDSFRQVWFFLVPQVDQYSMKSKLIGKPSVAFNFSKKVAPAKRTVASAGATPFEVREWGVGFLVEAPKR